MFDYYYNKKPNYHNREELIKAMLSMNTKVAVAKYFEITRQTLDSSLEDELGYVGPIENFKQAIIQVALDDDPQGEIANILVKLGIVRRNEPAAKPQTEQCIRSYQSYQPAYVCGNNNNLPCGLPFLAHRNNLSARNSFNNQGGLVHTIRQF